MRLHDFGATALFVLVGGFILGSIVENHLGPENWIEERIIEPLIKAKTGVEVDITPGSPDPDLKED